MDDLFSDIGAIVRGGSNRIVSVHNAVVDVAYQVPLTLAQYKEKLELGEQRFHGPKQERIGGGGINFALTASSLGFPGIVFAGFMDRCARCLVDRIKKAEGIRLPVHSVQTSPRRNTILELEDMNILFHDSSSSVADMKALARMVGGLGLSKSDWIASCSFYENITIPMMDLASRIFLDSGYGYPRREKMMMSRICGPAAERRLRDLVIAANETEMNNLCDEFGVHGHSLMDRGPMLADILGARIGGMVKVLLHTMSFTAVFEPGQKDRWAVPCLDISLRRRTNAGDTHAGAFMAAYDATGDARLAAFYGNAAAAKRLADDEMPTQANVAAFLRRSRLKNAEPAGARILGPAHLKEIMLQRASSACATASRGGARPALQILK
ncbi:MAG: hypothetical protein U0R44_06310 [Candidatus Micrarchaeia archaeon]